MVTHTRGNGDWHAHTGGNGYTPGIPVISVRVIFVGWLEINRSLNVIHKHCLFLPLNI